MFAFREVWLDLRRCARIMTTCIRTDDLTFSVLRNIKLTRTPQATLLWRLSTPISDVRRDRGTGIEMSFTGMARLLRIKTTMSPSFSVYFCIA